MDYKINDDVVKWLKKYNLPRELGVLKKHMILLEEACEIFSFKTDQGYIYFNQDYRYKELGKFINCLVPLFPLIEKEKEVKTCL